MKVYYFGAAHCGMCKVLRPRVEDWCNSNNAEFVYVDADSDDSSEMIATWGIKSIPSVGVLDGNRSFIARGIDGWNNFLGRDI